MKSDFEILKAYLLEVPFDKLMDFPHLSVLSHSNGHRSISATIWCDHINSDEIQIHVQIPSRWLGFLGIGYDNAIRIFRDGTWRYVTAEEWIKLGDAP